jgi:hypothetical protein
VSLNHGRRNFKDTNPLMSSLLVIFVWGGEAILYTAKKLIGNRLSRLKSASLFIKNTISSRGIFLASHSMLLYIIDSKKNFPTMLMGENPWYQRENITPRLCWEMPTIYRKILMPG